MESLLLPGVVVAIVGAFGLILWYLFKSAAAESIPTYPEDTDENDGNSDTPKNRTKKRPYQLRKRQKTTTPVEESSAPATRLEERNTHPGAKPSQTTAPVKASTTQHSPIQKRPARAPAAPATSSQSEQAASRKSRKVSFSEDAQTEAGGQEASTTTPAQKPAPPNGVSPASAPTEKTAPSAAVSKPLRDAKGGAKPSPPTKAKSPAKTKASRAAGASPSNVSDLARAIENANLSADDAQQLVDILLSASSAASEWVSKGSHGRTEETLESVRKARNELAAQLEEERAAHRSSLSSQKEKRAEFIEEGRQMKFKLEALQKALTQKTKEADLSTARARSLEEELDSKVGAGAPAANADVSRYVAENNRLKGELESAQSRLATSIAEVNSVKQGAKSTEAALNNQLQQAKSNAERQQKRARDLEKQVQAVPAKQPEAAVNGQPEPVNGSSSTDSAALQEMEEEVASLKKKVESWKNDAKKFEERLLASNAKTAELRETTWRAKDEAAAAQKNAKAEVKKTVDGLKAQQSKEAAAERDAVTKQLCGLFPSVQVSSDCKTLSSWVESFVEKADQEKASLATSAASSSDSSEEVTRLSKDLRSAEADVETWKARCEEAQAALGQTTQSLESLQATAGDSQSWKTRCEEAETVLAQTRSTLENIQAQVEEEDTKQMERLRELEGELDRVEATNVKLEQDLAKEKTECSSHQRQVISLRKELDQSKNTNSDMQKLLQQSSTRQDSQLTETTEKLRRTEAHLTGARSKLDEADRKAVAAEGEAQKSKKELEESNAKVEQMIASLNELRTGMSKLEAEKQELSEQLKDMLNASASASTDV